MSDEEIMMYSLAGYVALSIAICIITVVCHDIVKYNLFSGLRSMFKRKKS